MDHTQEMSPPLKLLPTGVNGMWILSSRSFTFLQRYVHNMFPRALKWEEDLRKLLIQDAFAWIEANFQAYHRNHMIALIVSSTLCANEIHDVISEYVTRVEGLYAIKQGNATVRRV